MTNDEKRNIQTIKDLIRTSPEAAERALLIIYRNQTSQEQSAEATILNNGIGFTGADAHYLSYAARWIEDGKHLSGKHLLKVQNRMQKYARQLLQSDYRLQPIPETEPVELISSEFTYRHEERLLTTEASDAFGKTPVPEVFAIRSAHTNKLLIFNLKDTNRHEGEITYWLFTCPTTDLRVTVYND